MDGLPPEAKTVDPALLHVGIDRRHQQLVYGCVGQGVDALLVARLLSAHPDGQVGKYYGTKLLGFLAGDE